MLVFNIYCYANDLGWSGGPVKVPEQWSGKSPGAVLGPRIPEAVTLLLKLRCFSRSGVFTVMLCSGDFFKFSINNLIVIGCIFERH